MGADSALLRKHFPQAPETDANGQVRVNASARRATARLCRPKKCLNHAPTKAKTETAPAIC